jgi:hypothetical protein
VVQKTVQQGASHGGVTGEDTGPVLEGDIGGDDNGAMLVAFGDDLEQQLSTSLVRGKVSQLVNNQRPSALVKWDPAQFTLYPKYLRFPVASIPFDTPKVMPLRRTLSPLLD